MKKPTLMHIAQAATAIAFMVLIAGQWALVTGPLESLAEYGQTLAENGNMTEFFGFFVMKVLIDSALVLVFGGIGICVIASYLAFERMQQRQAEGQAITTIEHGEQIP